tara:strand:+ start:1772 stop:2140 length:369 start_codon:yes stop_codon:yes gene_type:complete
MSDIIFDGKTLEDISKDIYNNSAKKRKQIDVLIKDLSSFIKNSSDVLQIAPIIKEFLDVSVKNDEHLVKLIAVLQRYVTKSNDSESEFILSDKEKKDLMDTLKHAADEIQKTTDDKQNLFKN